MLGNYIKTGYRNIVRHKSFALLNISGLAVGIASCLLIFIVVRYEMSYDQFQLNHQSIYRVVTEDKYADGMDYTPGVPFPALDALRLKFPALTVSPLFANYGSQVTVVSPQPDIAGKKFIEESGFFFTDPEFFRIFHYEWLAGSPAVLSQPNATVLSQKMAEKYFGDWKYAVGSLLKLDNAVTVKVAGILKNSPGNTDFPLNIVTSYETAKANAGVYGYYTDWGNTTSNFNVYMQLPPQVAPAGINEQLLQFSTEHYKDKNSKRTNFLQGLDQIHFDNHFGTFGDHTMSKSTLWTLSLIAVFIIVMACINFINLSTGSAVTRSKEIGIRKVLGSRRANLFWQMMGETGMVVFFSLILALGLAMTFLPLIKHVTSIAEPLSIFTWQTLLFAIGVAIAVTFFSGLYPALVLSGFQPMLALKNKITSATVGGISLRRALVVLQFAISQALIIGTIVAITQMSYLRKADLGFNKDALFIINTNSDSAVQSRQEAFKQSLLKMPGVQSVSFSSDAPSSDNNWNGNFAFDHKPDEKFSIYRKAGDEDYFKTYGLQLVAGRIFEKSDTMNEIVVNETLVKKLGLQPQDVIGKDIRSGRGGWRPVVGVVKDFRTNSLREDIKPLMLMQRKDRYSVTGVKIRSSNLRTVQNAIESSWNNYFPEYAYTSSYMDENIARFYEQEEQLSRLYKIFAGIAILISCLGLYGLVSFMAAQRTKEVGIRKVLGASVANIIYLFSKEFTILILIAFALAAPFAWYMMSNWLTNFSYRINIGFGVFAGAVVLSIIIAWATVGYRSIKAAIVNPVKSLRTE